MSRKLILTIGAPAVGKSTWLKENGLAPYVLEVDHLRTLVSEPIIHINKEGTIQKDDINYGKEHATWELLDQLIEQRMQQGQAIIVDATHLFKGSFGRYHELAKKYDYKMMGIDFMKDFIAKYGDRAKEELMKRDSGRDDKIGIEDVFVKYLDRYAKLKDSLETGSIIKVYTPQEFLDYIHDDTPVNLDEYDNIKIIGDIHADYSNLDKVFEQHKKGTFYIFVGDYLDRGSKNVETFRMLQTLKGKNLVFLRGNHEQAIQNWVYNHQKSGQFGRHTLEILLKAGITDKDLSEFVSRLQDYFLFSYKGTTYLVTHAGIINWPNRPLKLLYEDFFTLGLAEDRKTPYESDVDREYSRHVYSEDSNVICNIHGHRNEFEYNKEDWEFNYTSCNLTHEGEFRYLEIKDFIDYTSDTNPDMQLHIEKRIDEPSKVSEMFYDPEYVADTLDELESYLEKVRGMTREGVVLEGQNKMLKQKTDFYLKAKELRGALSLNHKKKNWYYGAEDWYIYCAKHHINRFSPELVLSLYQKNNK